MDIYIHRFETHNNEDPTRIMNFDATILLDGWNKLTLENMMERIERLVIPPQLPSRVDVNLIPKRCPTFPGGALRQPRDDSISNKRCIIKCTEDWDVLCLVVYALFEWFHIESVTTDVLVYETHPDYMACLNNDAMILVTITTSR